MKNIATYEAIDKDLHIINSMLYKYLGEDTSVPNHDDGLPVASDSIYNNEDLLGNIDQLNDLKYLAVHVAELAKYLDTALHVIILNAINDQEAAQ